MTARSCLLQAAAIPQMVSIGYRPSMIKSCLASGVPNLEGYRTSTWALQAATHFKGQNTSQHFTGPQKAIPECKSAAGTPKNTGNFILDLKPGPNLLPNSWWRFSASSSRSPAWTRQQESSGIGRHHRNQRSQLRSPASVGRYFLTNSPVRCRLTSVDLRVESRSLEERPAASSPLMLSSSYRIVMRGPASSTNPPAPYSTTSEPVATSNKPL